MKPDDHRDPYIQFDEDFLDQFVSSSPWDPYYDDEGFELVTISGGRNYRQKNS